jgi:uncharacterized protein YdiU (UPF0061 family)
METAAVVTRVAPQLHPLRPLRALQHTAGNVGALRTLADFVIDRFYPQCRETAANPAPGAALLAAVSGRTARAARRSGRRWASATA